MRRLMLPCAAILVLVGALGAIMTVAAAAPAACEQYSWFSTCSVAAQSGGASDGTSEKNPAAPKPAASAAATCTLTASGQAIPCREGNGWWLQDRQCYVQALIPPPPQGSSLWEGHSNGAIYQCTFYTEGRSFPGTNGFTFWSATPPAGPAGLVDPAQLAREALRTLTIPSPTTGRYPAGTMQDGTPFTVVGAYTWFWTDPDGYRPLTARADAGGVWAQVSVAPTALTFAPGDGVAAVSCRGPGLAWRPGDGVWAASPAGCDYRYAHSSIHQPQGQVTATYGIQWSVTWTSSTGASGVLPGLTTTATATFAVAEVESVVIR